VTLRHRVITLAVVLLPALAYTAGGEAGFTMYAASVEFRLEIVARDPDGSARALGPTSLASRVPASAAPFFAGSDHFRRTYGELPLRHRLHEVGRLACLADEGRATAIEVTLVERRRGGVTETRERVPCAG
jgi:hypothetical protein